MTDLSDLVRYHRDRAQRFQSHAAHSKAAETREMYLRLSRTEEALARYLEQKLRAVTGAGDMETQDIHQPINRRCVPFT
jgi:hypothetical protein